MIKLFFYHLKRILEYSSNIFFSRRLKGFKEKLSALITLVSLYLKSIGREKEMELTTRFFNFKVTGTNAASLLYLFQEIFLNKEYFFTATTNSPKIVDCGANIGVAILYFKKLYPEAEIIGIEPNPIAFRLLEKNVKQNNLKGVTLLNLCLSDKEGTESFFSEPGGTNNLSASIFMARGKQFVIEIPATRLSSIIRDSIFDLIKIDIEGAERQVFNDLKEKKLLACSRVYFMEYHHHEQMEDIFPQLLESYQAEGFKYNLRASFSKPSPFQDIFIGFYRE